MFGDNRRVEGEIRNEGDGWRVEVKERQERSGNALLVGLSDVGEYVF